jgi:environmental stress-induced protein Ves
MSGLLMSGQQVHLADVAPTPWKNGGGSTRELLAWPNARDWVCRVSVAEVVDNGPFSPFDGVQRWFAVLDGAGVRLQVDTAEGLQTHTLERSSPPLCFDGALPTHCALVEGPTQDFNLMLRQSHAKGHLQRVNGAFCGHTSAPKLIAAYAISMRVAVQFGLENWQLHQASLVWQMVPAGTAVRVVGDDALYLEIELCP